MSYSGKSDGNKLEQAVYQKLQNPDILSQLKADALMFHHIYSNLVMLAKSNDFNKSARMWTGEVLDLLEEPTPHFRLHEMRGRIWSTPHRTYIRTLDEIVLHPQTAMNRDFKVFASEERLYGPDKKCNHCLYT